MTRNEERQWVGIDVSQAKLDIALRPAGVYWQVPNDESGWQQLLNHLGPWTVALVVVESTGGMERGVVRTLQQQEFAVAVINPKRARDFSKASGRLAKTDRIDADMLAHFGEALQPLPKPLASEQQEVLTDLVHRRAQLVEMLNSERHRRHSARHRTTQAELISILSG
jgi:transposase